MSDSLIHQLGLWILLPSLALMLSAFFPSLFGLRSRVKKADYERQLAEFRRQLAGHSGEALNLDWMRFNGIPKQELVDLAAGRGWRLVGQDYGGKSWWLKFTYQPDVSMPSPQQRLLAELADAELDASGRYLLDPARYSSLPVAERDRIIVSAGWKKARLVELGTLALTRPGTTETHPVHEPKLAGLNPAKLREHPDVLDRARRFQLENGFDPLDPAELDRLRARNNHWLKKFLLPGAIASVLLALAPFPLLFGLREESTSTLLVGIALLAAGFIPAAIAWRVRRLRKADIGAHIGVLPELKNIYRGQP